MLSLDEPTHGGHESLRVMQHSPKSDWLLQSRPASAEQSLGIGPFVHSNALTAATNFEEIAPVSGVVTKRLVQMLYEPGLAGKSVMHGSLIGGG